MAKEIGFPTGNKHLDDFMMNVVWKSCPKVKLYDKRTSVLMWTLYVCGFMWIWMKDFFSNSHTTIGKRVYIKHDDIVNKNWIVIYRVMRHEFIHILQRSKYWIFYDIAYLMPQALGIFALFAILSVWFSNYFLFFLIFILFLFPWPAYWRMKFEMEGYTQSMLVYYELYGEIPTRYVNRIVNKFTTAFYYFMWPFRYQVLRKVSGIKGLIVRGKIRGPYLGYRS